MKVAIASDGYSVTEHFGHCEDFVIFTIDNNQIVGKETIPNPGHRPGFLPNFLHEQNVDVIITGGIGAGAIDLFDQLNIKVISGVMGSVDIAIQNYILGSLKLANNTCNHKH